MPCFPKKWSMTMCATSLSIASLFIVLLFFELGELQVPVIKIVVISLVFPYVTRYRLMTMCRINDSIFSWLIFTSFGNWRPVVVIVVASLWRMPSVKLIAKYICDNVITLNTTLSIYLLPIWQQRLLYNIMILPLLLYWL